MLIREVEIGSLKPYPKNAKQHDAKQIANVANSIKRFGWQQPIVIDRDDTVVIGHCRLLAAKKLGMKFVPVTVAGDLTEDEIRELRIADNKTNESPWDFELLADDLEGLDFDGFDFDFEIPGEEEEPVEVTEDNWDKPLPEEPRSKRGDIWQLGRHRLMCGDSTSAEDVDSLMGGKAADIAITSPPYGAGDNAHLRKHLREGYSGRDGHTFYGEQSDDCHEWPDLMEGFFSETQRVTMAQFVNVMMIGDNKRQLVAFVANHADNLVDIIVWNKHTCPPQIHENVLNNGYEFVFVFDNENSSRAIRFGNFRGSKSNYIETKKAQNEYASIHKAVFSIEFVDTILDINGAAQSVYEPFGGTGTTLITAEQRGKTCYCMEINPAYVDTIIDRWETFTGEKAVKLNE